MISRKLIALCVALAAGGVVTQVQAHELFLRAAKSPVVANSDQEVRLVNGTFDESENSISRDRMRNVSIVTSGRTTNPPAASWYDDQVSSYLKYKTAEPGTYVIGVSTLPRMIELPRADFIEYLKHDGGVDTLTEFEKGGNTMEKVRERYSKHVRAIVQVGDKKTDDFSKPLGYPVEILLEKNPAETSVGQQMSFRVLYQGKPIANQIVKASYGGFHGHDASGSHINAHTVRTDKDGRASFLLSNKALWYISLIYMQKLNQPDADYESNWATVTFDVK